MKYYISAPIAIIALLGPITSANAQPANFQQGALIEEYGPIATIEGRDPIPENVKFKVSFDVTDRSKAGELNRKFISAARFLNMHSEAGVSAKDMNLAIVIHGSAVQDVTNAAHYNLANEQSNSNALLIAELLKHGVEIYVCGQSAASQGITVQNLLPGVRMSLSAMTAHALLQQDGYTLNPF